MPPPPVPKRECEYCGENPLPGLDVCEGCAASIATSGTGRRIPPPEARRNPYAALWGDPEDYYDDEEEDT